MQYKVIGASKGGGQGFRNIMQTECPTGTEGFNYNN